jgi:MFS family permease
MPNPITNKKIAFAILVAALGYFVDGYDIAIFSAVRVASLKSLGLSGNDLTTTGAFLMNIQLVGMLLGGLGWGILGDKIGRLKVLFGSITLYSLANIANAYIGSVDQYAACRFIGGLGLAGEIGAGITLVSELMSKENRGYGTMLVSFVGVCGFAAAGIIGDSLTWQNAFITGGVMGVVLLTLRLSIVESSMFRETRGQATVQRGNPRLLFQSRERLLRYLCCIFSGAPTYIYLVMFVIFAPEIGIALGIAEPLKSGKAIFYACSCLAVGCVVAGYVSQRIRSRKTVMYIGIIGYCLLGFYLLNGGASTAQMYYAVFGCMCFFNGYWSVLISTAAEQFGTNLRATAATSVPNFVRSLGIVHSTLFIALKPIVGIIPAIEIILSSFTVIALISVWFLRETFGIDLNFVEVDAQHREQRQMRNKHELAG